MKIFCTSSVPEYNSADKQIRYVKNLTPKTPHSNIFRRMEALQSYCKTVDADFKQVREEAGRESICYPLDGVSTICG
jgi:hypothetical protein